MHEPLVIECFQLISDKYEDDELAVLNYCKHTYLAQKLPDQKISGRPYMTLNFYEGGTNHSWKPPDNQSEKNDMPD